MLLLTRPFRYFDCPFIGIQRTPSLFYDYDLLCHRDLSDYKPTFHYEENDKEVIISSDIHKNFSKDQINIELKQLNDQYYNLNIHIQYRYEDKDENGNVIGSYQSSTKKTMPIDSYSLDIKSMKAVIKGGMLFINIPKLEMPKQIESTNIPILEIQDQPQEKDHSESNDKEDVAIVTDVEDV